MPLSAHEQEVLAGIEEQMAAVDHRLAAIPNRKTPSRTHRSRFGFARATGSLALLLVALIPLAALILVLDMVALTVLIFTVAIPWSVSGWLDRAFVSMAIAQSQRTGTADVPE